MKTTLRCFLVLALAAAAPAKLKHLHQVDDHIWRGHQPQKQDFPVLAKMGIRTVLDLRGGSVHKPRERRYVEAAGMQYISIRLSGIWAPHDSQMAQVQAVLNDPQRWPIFIHCRRGADRIGMVLACYHIAHDHWSNRQALADARHLGLSRFEILMEHYILDYHPAPIPPEPVRASATVPSTVPGR